jgi:hypothetical protein
MKEFTEMGKKIVAFEQTERIAMQIAKLLEGYTYAEIAGILVTVERMVKDRSIFKCEN